MNFGAGSLGPAGLSSADLAANNNREPKIKKNKDKSKRKLMIDQVLVMNGVEKAMTIDGVMMVLLLLLLL